MSLSTEPEVPKGRRSSSKSQRRPFASTLSPPSLLSPPTTSISPATASSSSSSFSSSSDPGSRPGTGVGPQRRGLTKSPSVASLRQPQASVAAAVTSTPEVCVSMVYGEREAGTPLGSAERLLAVGLGSASSTASGSNAASGNGSGVGVGGASSADPLPASNLGMTPSTSLSTSSIATSRSPATSTSGASKYPNANSNSNSTLSSSTAGASSKTPASRSTGWFGSLGRNRGRQTSSSVSMLQEQHRKASKLSSPSSTLPLPPPSTLSSTPKTSTSTPASNTSTPAPTTTVAPTTSAPAQRPGKERAGTMGEVPQDHEHEHEHDAHGLPPMLTITDSFPFPLHESPSAEGVPLQSTLRALGEGPLGGEGLEGGEMKGQEKEEENGVVVLGGAEGAVGSSTQAEMEKAIPISSSPTTYATSTPTPTSAPSTTTTSTLPVPTVTSTAASPPHPSSLSTTPRKRSWFYSSRSSAPATPAPLTTPVPTQITASPLEDAVVHPPRPPTPPPPASTSSSAAKEKTGQWEGLTTTTVESPQSTSPPSQSTSALHHQTSPARPIPGRTLSAGTEGGGGRSGPSSIPSSIDDFVPPLPVTPPVPGSGVAQGFGVQDGGKLGFVGEGGAKEDGGKENANEKEKGGGKSEETKKVQGSTVGGVGGGSRFTLSIPLLGRAKIPLGVVLGDGGASADKSGKDPTETLKNGEPKVVTPTAPEGSASGNSRTDSDDSKAAPPTAPGTISTPSSNDTSTSTSSPNPTIIAGPSTEPVQSGEAQPEGDNASSPGVCTSESRPGCVEGITMAGDVQVNAPSQDLPPTTASSTPLNQTTADQQDAYYSWWSYVGWGSTPSVDEGGSRAVGAAGSTDAIKPVGSGGSGETAAHSSATTVDPEPPKDAGVGSTVDSGETEREKAKVTLEPTTTTTTLTTTSPSAPVAEANVNANGNESPPSNGKSFGAETSEDVVEGRTATGAQGNGRGKKADGEVDLVGASVDVGQGATRGEGNKLDGADSLALGSDAKSASEAGGVSGESLEEARSGSSWLSPWAWIGTSASTTTATTPSENVANVEPVGAPEASKEGDDGRDGVAVAQGVEGEAKEQKMNVAQNPADSSPEFKVDEAPEPTVATAERELELPNPIEESLKANRAGWTSFFSKQSLFVKAIGYGETSEPVKAIKRDQHGVEIMDLDSDDESESEHGSKKDDHSSNGGESRSRSLAPKLLTYPVEKLAETTSSSRNASPNTGGRSSAAKDGDPPAEPLTGDEDIKRKVASVPVSKPSKESSSGSSTPAPPSPSGSVPVPNTKQPQPPVVEKSKSAPVTPKRTASPSPSVTKKNSTSSSPPNLVLPTWADTFHTAPRSIVLRPPSPPVSPPTTPGSAQDTGVGTRLLGKTMKFVSNVLWAKDGGQHGGPEQHQGGSSALDGMQRTDRKVRRHFNAPHPLRRSSSGGGLDIASLLEQERKARFERYGQELPKSWEVLDGVLEDGASGKRAALNRPASSLSSSGADLLGHASAEEASRGMSKDMLRGCRRVVIIGVHGWFPGALMRTMFGEPTGTSSKFANMMEQAVQEFENAQGVQLEKITKIPLEGEGTIERRVEKLYSTLIANAKWMDDLREADAIFVATHSQGSVVSTHLMSKLVEEGVIYTRPEELVPSGGDTFPSAVGLPRSSERKVQRVCCLALCGIHLGPLRYLRSSSVVAPYIQYFENAAARELFEFQNTESAVSRAYVKALENVLDHGIKMVYVASLNDQVVPIYSGIFTAATHPLLLRALYIDGDAYHSSDFLSNLLVLLLKLRNSGIPDGGLLTHLSEATAGSLSGVGHSTAYEELATYSLAVRYLFMTNDGSEKHPTLVIEPFDAAHEQNDYEIPWSLRDVIADERVIHFFSNEVSKLRDAFRDWHPKTTILRDLKRKLQPIQRLPPSFSSGSYSTSKL